MVVRGESGGVKISYLEVSGKTGKVFFLLYAVVSSIFTLIALNLFLVYLGRSRKSITESIRSAAVIEGVVFVSHLQFRSSLLIEELNEK